MGTESKLTIIMISTTEPECPYDGEAFVLGRIVQMFSLFKRYLPKKNEFGDFSVNSWSNKAQPYLSQASGSVMYDIGL